MAFTIGFNFKFFSEFYTKSTNTLTGVTDETNIQGFHSLKILIGKNDSISLGCDGIIVRVGLCIGLGVSLTDKDLGYIPTSVELKAQNQIDLSIVNCRFPTDCPGLLPGDIEYKHQIDAKAEQFGYPQFNFTTSEIPGGKRITINPQENGCYPILIQDSAYMEDAMPVCAYQVTLKSSVYRSPIEYNLAAISEGHQWLFIGMPKFSSVLQDQYVYYLLRVPHPNVKFINIQLTRFSGDLDLFVSKTEKYPNSGTADAVFSHEGLTQISGLPVMNGTYYIAIKGVSTASFSIAATVIGNDDKPIDYAVNLQAGQPQRGVLMTKSEHPSGFYKFKLDQSSTWKGTIRISAQTMRGNILIAVNNNDEVPLPNVHQWKSTGFDVVIQSTDPMFLPNATYYVGIFVDWNYAQADDIVYTVTYSTKEDAATITTPTGTGVVPVTPSQQEHLFISPLTPYQGSLKKGEVSFFEAFILPKDNSITIYKQADAGDVDLYISLDTSNEFPGPNKYNYTTRYKFENYITINEEDIKKACADESLILCTFFIGVYPLGETEVSYSLSMKRDYVSATPTLNPLYDGVEAYYNVPKPNEPVMFYFYTQPEQPSVITVMANNLEITMYANKKKVELGKSDQAGNQIPSAQSYHLTSEESVGFNQGFAHLVVPVEPETKKDPFVVTLAVYFQDVSKSPDGSNQPRDSSFSILVSSSITKIFTGRPQYGTVQKDQYTYFYLDVYRPSTTLLFSMTSLDDGDPDLVVSMNNDERPTLENHMFASVSKQRTEVLEIDEFDIYPFESMQGTWVIGVYGRTAASFTLTVMYEDQKMVELWPNIPFETYISDNSMMYFRFYHTKDSDVQIKVDQLSGSMTAYIGQLKENEDLASNLPGPSRSTFSYNPKYDPVYTIPKDKACKDCVYVVALNTTAASKLSISINEGGRFSQITSGLRYSDQLNEKASKVYMFSSPNVEEVSVGLNMRGSMLKVCASHSPTVDCSQKDGRDNFIWTATLTPSTASQEWVLNKEEANKRPDLAKYNDGTKTVDADKNQFYLYFENPFYAPVNYSFVLTPKDSNAALKPGVKHVITIPAERETSLLYYSSTEDDVLKLSVEFVVERAASNYDTDFDLDLKRGLPVKANYMSEKVTAGVGQEISMTKTHIMKDKVVEIGDKKKYFLRESFTTASRKGKYLFAIKNPFYTDVIVSVTAYTSEFGSLSLDQNAQHSSSLTKGIYETFEIFLEDRGAWYTWAFSCAGNITLAMENNPESLYNPSSLKTLPVGEGYLMNKAVEGSGMKYVAIGNPSYSEGDAQFFLSSSFFQGERIYNYMLRADPSTLSLDYSYKSLNSKVIVNVAPIYMDDVDSADSVVYHAKICPLRPDEEENKDNFCLMHEDCRTSMQTTKMNSDDNIEISFERLLPRNYYVHVTADIMHNNKLIKFVPYPVATINVKQGWISMFSEMLGTIIVALCILVVASFICFKCYGKVKELSEERGFELPVFGKKREYGFLGDDL